MTGVRQLVVPLLRVSGVRNRASNETGSTIGNDDVNDKGGGVHISENILHKPP